MRFVHPWHVRVGRQVCSYVPTGTPISCHRDHSVCFAHGLCFTVATCPASPFSVVGSLRVAACSGVNGSAMFALVVSAIVSTILVMLRGPVYNDVLRIVVSSRSVHDSGWVGGFARPVLARVCPVLPCSHSGQCHHHLVVRDTCFCGPTWSPADRLLAVGVTGHVSDRW